MTIQFQKYPRPADSQDNFAFLFDSGEPMRHETITEAEAKEVITEAREVYGPENTEEPSRWTYLLQCYRIQGRELKQKVTAPNGVNQVHYRLVVMFREDSDATQFELRWR